MDRLDTLEEKSVYILREAYAKFGNLAMPDLKILIEATSPEQLRTALKLIENFGHIEDRYSDREVLFAPDSNEQGDDATDLLDEHEIPYRNV